MWSRFGLSLTLGSSPFLTLLVSIYFSCMVSPSPINPTPYLAFPKNYPQQYFQPVPSQHCFFLMLGCITRYNIRLPFAAWKTRLSSPTAIIIPTKLWAKLLPVVASVHTASLFLLQSHICGKKKGKDRGWVGGGNHPYLKPVAELRTTQINVVKSKGILKVPSAAAIRQLITDHSFRSRCWFYGGRKTGEPRRKSLEARERPTTTTLLTSSKFLWESTRGYTQVVTHASSYNPVRPGLTWNWKATR